MMTSFAQWWKKNPGPSVERLIDQYGSVDQIPPEAWAKYDEELKAWQAKLAWRHVDDF